MRKGVERKLLPFIGFKGMQCLARFLRIGTAQINSNFYLETTVIPS